MEVEVVLEPTLMLIITDHDLGIRYTDLGANGSVELIERIAAPDDYRLVENLDVSYRTAIQARFALDELLAGRCLRTRTGQGNHI